jgi:ankyrin repeat protein
MSPSLPEQPDLDHLRKQAKALLRDAESGDAGAIARLRDVPRLHDVPAERISEAVQLADAQHAIAREHGSESWPKLKAQVEAGLPLETQAEHFLERVRAQDVPRALRWLERTPAIAGVSLFTACAAGDAPAVERLLAGAPALATATHSHRKWPPLLYACASPVASDTPALAGIVRTLLAGGADANTRTPQVDQPKYLLSALYFACVRDHAGVVRALLERGAGTQDGESIYHAAELDHRASLGVLAEFGADFSATQQPFGNTPLYFLAGYSDGHDATVRAHSGMRWLLEHGADPNVPSGEKRETPLHQVARMGGGPGITRALLAHGADPNAARADGRTPYASAYRRGDVAMCEELLAAGAHPVLAPADEFLGAALRGDEAAARATLAAEPGLIDRLQIEDHAFLAQLTTEQRGDSVALLVSLGYDLGWEGAWGGTALHHAAWRGHVAMARRLVELGAPLEVRDRTYGSSPLAWAAHGSQFCRTDDEAYLAIVRMLLEAGAGRAASFNRWGEPPENLGSPRVNAFLRRWYREHPAAG